MRNTKFYILEDCVIFVTPINQSYSPEMTQNAINDDFYTRSRNEWMTMKFV